jgi:hypothetical protein
MPRQTLTKLTALGTFPALPLTANSADLTMTAADATNKEQFVASGNDLIIAHNTGASTRTITVTSVADGQTKRTGDITTFSLGAGEYAAFGPFGKQGWMQADGKIYLEASHAEVKFGVVQLA